MKVNSKCFLAKSAIPWKVGSFYENTLILVIYRDIVGTLPVNWFHKKLLSIQCFKKFWIHLCTNLSSDLLLRYFLNTFVIEKSMRLPTIVAFAEAYLETNQTSIREVFCENCLLLLAKNLCEKAPT